MQKILIVEDDIDIQDILKNHLTDSCLCRAIRPVRHDLVSSPQDGTTVTGERITPGRKASVAACGR